MKSRAKKTNKPELKTIKRFKINLYFLNMV